MMLLITACKATGCRRLAGPACLDDGTTMARCSNEPIMDSAGTCFLHQVHGHLCAGVAPRHNDAGTSAQLMVDARRHTEAGPIRGNTSLVAAG
jgi:hypothetical protein